jgi:hypothetical protein
MQEGRDTAAGESSETKSHHSDDEDKVCNITVSTASLLFLS